LHFLTIRMQNIMFRRLREFLAEGRERRAKGGGQGAEGGEQGAES